ncbi:MAG TPA: hypothetical protein VIL46_05425 [Gemmataceae bacterium]
MAKVTCPYCEIVLTRQEVADGWCETCGKKLPPNFRDRGRAFGRSDAPGTVSGVCDLCGERRPGVSTCYLQLIRQKVGITGDVQARYINVSCNCCEACYRRGRGLRRLAFFALGAMFVLPLLLCGGVGILLKELGLPEKGLNDFLAVATFVSFVGFFGIPVYVHFALRRRLRKLLPPDVDARLRSLHGGRGWGLFRTVVFSRKLREGQEAVRLGSL